MKNTLLLFFCYLACTCHAQETVQQNKVYGSQIVDSILEKVWMGFSFDTSNRKYHYNQRIRIIDLSQKITSGPFYYKKIPVSVNYKIPLNFNNGDYRDVVFNEYDLKNDTLSIKVFFCAFNPGFAGIRQPFLGTFSFKLDGKRIHIIESKIEELGNWSGYIEGW